MAKSISDKHIGELDFWKFFFCIMIAVHHSYYMFDGDRIFFNLGSIAVEFFFIVSGYLMAVSVMRSKTEYSAERIGPETSSFIFRKIRGFLPYYIFTSFVILAINLLSNSNDIIEVLKKSVNAPAGALLLHSSGITTYDLTCDTSVWYLSAMLISMIFLYPLMRKNSGVFLNIIAPLTVLFIYGYIAKKDGYIGGPFIWYGAVYKGILRAIAGICLGCVAYRFSEILKTVNMKKWISYALSVVEILLVAAAVALVYKNIPDKSWFSVVLAFFVLVVISASRKAAIGRLFQNQFCIYLGRLSISVYLIHVGVTTLFNYLFKKIPQFGAIMTQPHGHLEILILFLAVSVFLGVVCDGVCATVLKQIKARRDIKAAEVQLIQPENTIK